MSRRGGYDNAVAESFRNIRKLKVIPRCESQDRVEAQNAFLASVAVVYARSRRHASIGNLSPMHFEPQRIKAAYPSVR